MNSDRYQWRGAINTAIAALILGIFAAAYIDVGDNALEKILFALVVAVALFAVREAITVLARRRSRS